MMKTIRLILIACNAWFFSLMLHAQENPSVLWVQFDDRFTNNELIALTDVDSIGFSRTSYKLYKTVRDRVKTTSKDYRKNGVYRFDEVERTIVKPSEYANVLPRTAGAD